MGKKKKILEKVGGGWFFLSLIFLTISIILLLPTSLLTIVLDSHFSRWRAFIGSSLLGVGIAMLLIRGALNTAIHEFKHKVLSGFIGNKAKSVSINGEEGSFEYEYTEDTAKYNAFISLAPYFLPVFTIITLIFWGFKFSLGETTRVAILGVAYGIDLTTGLRDISPHQTDFKSILGGYKVGLWYVICLNILIGIFVLTWVAADFNGVAAMLTRLFNWLVTLVNFFVSFKT